MNATEARDYLKLAAATEVGREALAAMGLARVAAAPEKGDDESSIRVAAALAERLRDDYPAVF